MHERNTPPGGRHPFALHNESVGVDRQADACRCPACLGLANRGPAALAGATYRGPVQCESGALDPLDARAMAEIEGGRR